MSNALPARRKALVVEDSLEMRSALRDLFTTVGGFDVDFVGGETQATSWMEHHQEWDLAVVDLVLDEGSGFNIVRRFRRQPRSGSIVVLSNFISPAIRETCRENGADAVFHKDDADLFAEYVEALAATQQSAPDSPAANAAQFRGGVDAQSQGST